MFSVSNLFVKVFQLDGDLRGVYRVLYTRYCIYDGSEEEFAYVEGGKLHWFQPNAYFHLVDMRNE